jgi:thiosulfate/3-mercaptopyruvate sulfurtransferase
MTSRTNRRVLALTVATCALASTPAHAQPRTPAPAPLDSMVVSTDWLAAHLNDPRVVVVEVTLNDSARTAAIPGSRAMQYRRMVVVRDSISTELPPADSLRATFEALGISDDTRVVAYAREAPMATRLLMTLDQLGHRKFSYLDGGLAKWRAENRPVVSTEPRVTRGTMTVRPRDLVVTADWITARIGKPGVALIDTRTDGEYNGTGNRSGMPSAGHLAGARQLEWEMLFSGHEGLQLKPRAELQALFNARAKGSDTVVTYCWVGYRASATYFAARLLGFDARFYDGSYQDWQKRKLAVRSGSTP